MQTVSKINSEALDCVDSVSAQHDWERDFVLVKPWLVHPCFILYRTDNLSTTGSSQWILFNYVPDVSLVRDKMLYASSKNALVKGLGESLIENQIFCSTPQEVSFTAYKAYLTHLQAEAPLTERELEVQAIKQSESTADISVSSRRANAPGVSFPLSQDALDAVAHLKTCPQQVVVLVLWFNLGCSTCF